MHASYQAYRCNERDIISWFMFIVIQCTETEGGMCICLDEDEVQMDIKLNHYLIR